MLGLQIVLLLALLAVCSLGPGLMCVRRLGWEPLETVVAAIGLSHLFMFLVGMLMFSTSAPAGAELAVTAGCLAAAFTCRRDIAELVRDARVRTALLVWLGLLAWLILISLAVRNFSGGSWFGDWYGHFDRVSYFAARGDQATRYQQVVGGLTARPPLMNLFTANILNQAGLRFSLFQVSFVYLNSLAFLGAALFATSPRAIRILGGLVAVAPFFVQNSVYAWTKLYAAFFISAGVWFYARGSHHRSRSHMIVAFVLLAGGMVTHYSAGPYLVILTLHYLGFEWLRRERRLSEVSWIAGLGTLVLAPWFGWAIYKFGLRETFASNTSVQGFATDASFWASIRDVLDNLGATLLPLHVSDILLPHWGPARSSLVRFRDVSFIFLQHNLVGILGISSVLALGWLVASRSVRTSRWWWTFGIVVLLLGVGVHGGGQTAHPGATGSWGVGHICLQPLVLMGLAYLGNHWSLLPRAVAALVVTLKAGEALIGIGVQTWLQSMAFRSPLLGRCANRNLRLKQRFEVPFLGDAMPGGAVPIVVLVVLVVAALSLLLWRWQRAEETP